LKKTVTKGDRKKKKEIDNEIEKLENDFEEKCRLELETQISKSAPEIESFKANHVTVAVELEEDDLENKQKSNTKTSKSKKRKEKKEKSNEDREKMIQLQEIENKKGPAFIELTKIKEKLIKMNLKLKEVMPDGNCMYYAIIDQMNQNDDLKKIKNYQELRNLTSRYMLENPNEFQAYLCSEETGDPLNEQEYEEYCNKINDTLVWGGQIELKAISDLLKIKIEVVQAEGSVIQIGESFEHKIVITYHRHMFGSGEHYNSTCSNIKADSNEEDN
jgi:OTU domain-containing protein 6